MGPGHHLWVPAEIGSSGAKGRAQTGAASRRSRLSRRAARRPLGFSVSRLGRQGTVIAQSADPVCLNLETPRVLQRPLGRTADTEESGRPELRECDDGPDRGTGTVREPHSAFARALDAAKRKPGPGDSASEADLVLREDAEGAAALRGLNARDRGLCRRRSNRSRRRWACVTTVTTAAGGKRQRRGDERKSGPTHLTEPYDADGANRHNRPLEPSRQAAGTTWRFAETSAPASFGQRLPPRMSRGHAPRCHRSRQIARLAIFLPRQRGRPATGEVVAHRTRARQGAARTVAASQTQLEVVGGSVSGGGGN